MGNAAIALRAALIRSGDSLAQAVARAERHKKKSTLLTQDLSKLRQESKAREEGLLGQLKEAESRVQSAEAKSMAASAKVCAADAQVEDLTRKLNNVEGQIAAARNEALAATERAAAAEIAVAEARHEKAGAEAYANDAHARAEEAENRAQAAEAQAAEIEARALQAEARAKEAESRIERAIADFKSSTEFEREVVEASLDAYAKGFDSCKAKVSAAFNLGGPELDAIQAGDLGEELGDDGEEAEESVPGEP